MDSKMVFVFLLFTVAIVHNAYSESATADGDEENSVEPERRPVDLLTVLMGDDGGDQHAAESADDPRHHEPTATATAATTATTAAATAAAKGDRSGRQLYQPFVAYPSAFPQRRAYRGVPKKRPSRAKPGRRPRPHRRRPSGPPPQSAGRYRRLPGPVRAQHVNYLDAASADYYDEDAAVAYEPSGPQHAAAAMPYVDYVEQRELDREPAYAVLPSSSTSQLLAAGRSRKRPVVLSDEPQVVHVPVLRVIRPTVVAATAATTAAAVDPMEKLRQLVHEAMDAHFANRHQDLYSADGTFDDKQRPQHHVYSAKYKRQPAAADRDKADAVKSTKSNSNNNSNNNKDLHALQYVSYATPPPPPPEGPSDVAADADADGSDDRLTLAEISAYMGAKPAETVLSAGGHRYVLSDALQHSYRHQQQHHQHQQEQQEQPLVYGGDGQHRYLRYVSPFEAMYELPAARWAYK